MLATYLRNTFLPLAAFCSLLSVCLAACGGGGGGSADTTADATADATPGDSVDAVDDVDAMDAVDAVDEAGELDTPDAVDIADSADAKDAADAAPDQESLTVLDFKLPVPCAGIAAAAGDSGEAYIFGGDIGGGKTSPQIVRFTPDSGAAVVPGTELPLAVKAMSAAWVAGQAVVFGGIGSGGSPTDAIQRFDPAGPSTSLSAAKLPDILSYDPAGDAVDEVAKLLQPTASRIGGVWSGESAFIIGGIAGGSKTDKIQEFSPADGSVVWAAAKLAFGMDGGAYAYLDGRIYVFGGEMQVGMSKAIQVIDPVAGTTTVSQVELAAPWRGGAAAVIDNAIYVFGGTGTAGLSNQVIRYVPGP
jgi:hypothetical protein